jgi:hypothetical protein
MDDSSNWSRRGFLNGLGATVPMLQLLPAAAQPAVAPADARFTPVNLSRHFNASAAEFGSRTKARGLTGAAEDGLVRIPNGAQRFRGIPFQFGVEGVQDRNRIALSTSGDAWANRQVDIPIRAKATFVCLAAFCDWDENETPAPGADVFEQVGQHLADAVLVYDDGSEHRFPIRRRFEVNAVTTPWGHQCFTAVPASAEAPSRLADPLSNAFEWGELQTVVDDGQYAGAGPDGRPKPRLYLSALENPHPQRALASVRFTATSSDAVVLCGLTLFHGLRNPLRYERRQLYRLTLPVKEAEKADRWKLDLDLGVIARRYTLADFAPDSWLASPYAGLGERGQPLKNAPHLYLEITASPDATLRLTDTSTGKRYAFDLARAASGERIEAEPQGASIQVLERERAWVHGQVLDAGAGKPTPVRIAFRSPDGRYIPPYGHRTDINPAWFQDYGADVKIGSSQFAYIDGTFQIELPVGDVYVEISKGFEYRPVRQRLNIAASQRELTLELPRLADFRAQGWITADTHVHFLSPSTAVLEGQAEGLNLINLLAAQWGDLYTNVGDLAHGPVTSRDGDTIVRVGTENRQHLLGHLGLLGARDPVFPMSASGPSEAWLGDPLWTSMSAWADECRRRDGLVVAVHFPYPTAELAAEIVLGKVDAVELYPQGRYFNNLRYLDWYHYLNCGYRLPAAGGTDKMSASVPVGSNRTYAYLGQEEFSFANWAKAVRSGRTFQTTGPLLSLEVDGRRPGEEIRVGGGGGTVEVKASAKCYIPIHRLEIVWNGKVVASREERAGAHDLTIQEKVTVDGPGWFAARCSGSPEPPASWNFGVQAHTSPVYVTGDKELFSAPAAAYLLTLIDGSEAWVTQLATRPGLEQFARILQVFKDARERLHRRLHAHGIEHA